MALIPIPSTCRGRTRARARSEHRRDRFPFGGASRDQAPRHTFEIASCTGCGATAEAQNLPEDFRSTADILSARSDARASACAVAVDHLRLALQLAGLS